MGYRTQRRCALAVIGCLETLKRLRAES